MKITLLILSAAALSACTAFDNYDRSYSLGYTDGKQTISLGATIHPRLPARATGLAK